MPEIASSLSKQSCSVSQGGRALRTCLKNLLTKDVETLIDPVRYAAGEPILAAISSQYEIPVEESTALLVLAQQKKGMFS